jgi:hypothetical protein
MRAGVESRHPDYTNRIEDWRLMRRAARGNQAIKDEGAAYLPMPDGFTGQEDGGVAMYDAYMKRTLFPGIVKPTQLGMMGLVHRLEAKIELPAALKPLIEKCTPDGLTLAAFHKRITREILLQGRYGVLVDAPPEGADLPYLAGYTAEAIINWDPKRDFFVLDESAQVRDENGYSWKDHKKYRTLRLKDGVYVQEVDEESPQPGTDPSREVTPIGRGAKRLQEIPFAIAGPIELSLDPDDPPLLEVAQRAVAIYQLYADYRYQLFMTGQETLFCFGFDAPSRIGAGVTVSVKRGANEVGAQYIGPGGKGIEMHATAIDREAEAAVAAGARILSSSDKAGVEAADAMRIRFAAQMASLSSISLSSAALLEKSLRHAAAFVGANPNEVTVKANTEFVDATLTPAEASELVRGWQAGGYAYETLYDNLLRGGIANPDRTADQERALMETEDPLDEAAGGGAPGEDEEEAEAA